MVTNSVVICYFVCPTLAVAIAIWCFKGVFYRGPYQMYAAWQLNKIAHGLDNCVKEQKKLLFQSVGDYGQKVGCNLKILEIGSGAAPNVKYYPADTELVCLEPNIYMDKHAEKFVQSNVNIKSIEFVHGFSEDIPLESKSFDVVVCTFVLCSVSDIPKSLKEIQRVLKPGGLFLFLEHVVAESTTWARLMQRVMKPVHIMLYDGCYTDRDTEKVIRDSSMKDIHVERFQASTLPMWIRPCIFGHCSK